MAEIVPVVSEALEAQIRNLLPSQRGFGEDLQASNVITPIIDLTAAAQGTSVPDYQAQALAFGNSNNFNVANTTTTIISNTGFWRLTGTILYVASTQVVGQIRITDGLAQKAIFGGTYQGSTTISSGSIDFDFIIFLAAGESCNILSDNIGARFFGSYRQVADINGNPVNPIGFTPQ